jgi:rhamnosyltransferase
VVGIIIVTFNSVKKIEATLKSASLQNMEIVVVDNNSTDGTIDILTRIDYAHIILNKKNYGIAKALNQGVEYFKEKDYDWVLTLDHDTVLPRDYILKFEEYYKAMYKNGFCSFTPVVIDVKTNISIMYNKKREQKMCITSGNIISVYVWKVVGGFDDDLFIDHVDTDFCRKLRLAGYKIALMDSLKIYHDLGDATLNVSFFFFNIIFALYSRTRKYYILRNSIILVRRYAKYFPGYCFKLICINLLMIYVSLLVESLKASGWMEYISGFFDGLIFDNTKAIILINNIAKKIE